MCKTNDLRWLGACAIVGLALAGGACTDASVTKAKADAATTADKMKVVAGDVADKSKELALAAGDAASDTWITAKVKAKFADEKILNGTSLSIETKDHVVTLSGAAPSAAAQVRAVEIATGTEHVTRVVDNLVVRKS